MNGAVEPQLVKITNENGMSATAIMEKINLRGVLEKANCQIQYVFNLSLSYTLALCVFVCICMQSSFHVEKAHMCSCR